MLAWCATTRVQHAGLGTGARTQLSMPRKFGMPNSKSSMLDFLWGVQDSLGGAKSRDSSRLSHSPLAAKIRGGMSCLA